MLSAGLRTVVSAVNIRKTSCKATSDIQIFNFHQIKQNLNHNKTRFTKVGESARISLLKNFEGGNCPPCPPASYAYVWDSFPCSGHCDSYEKYTQHIKSYFYKPCQPVGQIKVSEKNACKMSAYKM